MFNDNYPDDGYQSDRLDAATKNPFDPRVDQVIQENASWLQSSPRTTQEIAAHLFPLECSKSPVRTTIFGCWVELRMWDAGYALRPLGPRKKGFNRDRRWFHGHAISREAVRRDRIESLAKDEAWS